MILWASWLNADPRRFIVLSFAATLTLGLIGIVTGGGGVSTNGFVPGGSD
jgi:hypothetical protein